MDRRPLACSFRVEAEKKLRLDLFLKNNLPYLSRSFIQGTIQRGEVKVDGELREQDYSLQRGEIVTLTLSSPIKMEVKPEAISLDILWEDESLMVVNKPPGMLVHPTSSQTKGTLVNALLHHSPRLSTLGGWERRGIVHRLDKDTSGAMVVAKDDHTHLALASQFRKRIVKKIYLALVQGNPPQDEGRIATGIERSSRSGIKMSVKGRGGREAVTEYKVLKKWENSSLLKLHPLTGRTHQIRLHLHSINCYLAGDKLYGGRKGRGFPYPAKRTMLHARALGFFHPGKRDWMEFTAPLPRDMKEAMEFLNSSGRH
ncbi:Ribosomal large subunit pseudouridine synthase D [subsurface metagenome]